MHRLVRSWIAPAAVLIAAATGGPAAASLGSTATAATAATSARPAVEICGLGPAVVKPASMILTCADGKMTASQAHWRSWNAAQATATAAITWLASTNQRDHTTADLTLSSPVRQASGKTLFTKLALQVTGATPPGFARRVTFGEAPVPAAKTATPAGGNSREGANAASGTLNTAAIGGFWELAGGPSSVAETAEAITGAESSFEPGIIQAGQPYSTTGWGLWQITPGDSIPGTYGQDFQLLDPWNNAEGAINKYDAAGGFTPWTTYVDGAYKNYLQYTSPPNTNLTDPGQYVSINSAPSGTHNSSDPGSTYGPPLPNAATSYVFWKGQGTGYDLWEAQGSSNAGLSGPTDRGMGPLGSPPAAAVDPSNGYTYVYWEGGAPADDLFEAYWNGSKWVGPYNRGMGPLGSQPSAAVSGSGTAYVFWKGQNGDLEEASGPATGALSGPADRGMGPLGSAPAVGINSSSYTYVYWEGTSPQDELYEAYWNGSKFAGPYSRGMGPMGSAPSAAVTGSGTAYVFWKGQNGSLYEAQGAATGALSGPADRGMGPLGSAPSAGVSTSGATYVYWEGTSPQDELYEAYWNGSKWVGPYNRGQGPLNSPPSVAVYK
jgi:hypothetical protein